MATFTDAITQIMRHRQAQQGFGGAPAGQNAGAFAPGGYYNPLPSPTGAPSSGGLNPYPYITDIGSNPNPANNWLNAGPFLGPFNPPPNVQQLLQGGVGAPGQQYGGALPAFQNPQNGLGQAGGGMVHAGGRVSGTPIGANFGAGWDMNNPQVKAYYDKIMAQQAMNAARSNPVANPILHALMANWGGGGGSSMNLGSPGPLRTGQAPTTNLSPEEMQKLRNQHQSQSQPASAQGGTFKPSY